MHGPCGRGAGQGITRVTDVLKRFTDARVLITGGVGFTGATGDFAAEVEKEISP